jgi:hypothetical protein
MRWEDERYVRVYTRNTGEWLALDWEARALFLFLLRVADRAGLIPTGKAGLRGLAGLAGMPLEVVERAAPMLLEDGCLRAADGGYIIPNFMAAQEARSSDAQRKRDQRERDRDKAMASGASGSRSGLDAEAAIIRSASRHTVTQDGHAMESHSVTRGHCESHSVTPSLAVPSLAVTASQDVSADAAPPAAGERPPLTLTAPDSGPKPRAPRKPSAAEALYLQIQEARQARCESAGVPFTPDRWDNARQNKALGPIAKVAPGTPLDPDGLSEDQRRFNLAFTGFLGDDRHMSKGWPLSLFMSGGVRSRYEQQALMEAAS